MPGKRLIHVCILVSFVIVTGCEKYEYCPPGQSWCWAQCVDLNNDDKNCGSCEHACDANEDCVNGSCLSSCTCISDDDCGTGACCVDDCVCASRDCTGLECGPDPVCDMSCGDCGSGLCINGECTGGCTTREDCAGPVCLVCKDYECVPPPPVCQVDQDCCAGYWCNLGFCEGEEPHCYSDDECLAQNPETPRCQDGRCVPECITDIDCPLPEMTCIDNHCANVETGQPGDPCPYGTVNATADYCIAGLYCLGSEDFGLCPGGFDYECNGIPDVYNPDCVDGVCGFSVCAEECDSPGECPDGFAPVNVNRTCYCMPFSDGRPLLGEPCPFGEVNPDAQYCYPDLECLGRAADGNSGTCPGGEPTECTEYPSTQNPDCVNGNCGYSFCAARCDVVGNCETGFEPLDVNGTCYCIPGAVGNSQPGEPCPFGVMNNSYEFCEAGLTCHGSDSAGSCPTGSAVECNQIPAIYNPDCQNGACGYSFCSPVCDAMGNCPAGFQPENAGGDCYCVPTE